MSTSAPGDPLASFRLDDRLIVVTGASEGIGRAFAECFAKAGAQLVLASRQKDKLEQVRAGIAASGGRAEVVVADVTRLDDIGKLAAAVGRLAQDRKLVLVNNAGFGFTKPALDVTEQDWDKLYDTHLKGTFFCCQKIGALMLERGYGKIVNLSSAWSASTDAGKSIYSAAKAAVSQLTAALSTEWAPRGVRVNAIAPGIIDTPLTAPITTHPDWNRAYASRTALKRWAHVSEMAGPLVFLISDAASYITATVLHADAGWTAIDGRYDPPV